MSCSENHILDSHPIFIGENAKPQGIYAVRKLLYCNAIDTLQRSIQGHDFRQNFRDNLERKMSIKDPTLFM